MNKRIYNARGDVTAVAINASKFAFFLYH